MVVLLGGTRVPGAGGVKLVEPTVLEPTRGSPDTASTKLSRICLTRSSHSWKLGLKDGLPAIEPALEEGGTGDGTHGAGDKSKYISARAD